MFSVLKIQPVHPCYFDWCQFTFRSKDLFVLWKFSTRFYSEMLRKLFVSLWQAFILLFYMSSSFNFVPIHPEIGRWFRPVTHGTRFALTKVYCFWHLYIKRFLIVKIWHYIIVNSICLDGFRHPCMKVVRLFIKWNLFNKKSSIIGIKGRAWTVVLSVSRSKCCRQCFFLFVTFLSV